MLLQYQQQDCAMTLREGIAEYRAYLTAIERKIMVDSSESRLLLEHDATHVIFGMDTTLEQEAGLDTWLLWGCQWRLSYIRKYGKLPEIKALYRAFVKELGWTLFPRLMWRTRKLKWRVIKRSRSMSKKWPYQFPAAWLDRSINELRQEHGVIILNEEERSVGEPLAWSGHY
ncbi:hypothetical protein N9C27_02140 [Luminiphilus sp.]|nr:hypothetical protein [Luminiphilus sp.]MDA9580124.1 hypothetical protein [Luminiphilus sp.]MDA9847655.1 hypothetical protein [Luminiphilus sp.]MDC3405739.1 hypothetical protein [Luminiphilus sp.]